MLVDSISDSQALLTSAAVQSWIADRPESFDTISKNALLMFDETFVPSFGIYTEHKAEHETGKVNEGLSRLVPPSDARTISQLT